MDAFELDQSNSINPYKFLFRAAALIPRSHYLLGFLFVLIIYLYNFLDFHFLEDLCTGFRGSPVSLTYNSRSEIYHQIVSKCRILHGRYAAPLWLSSPHMQTVLLELIKRPAIPRYKRKLFHASDGGTLALDWLLSCDVSGSTLDEDNFISKEDMTPIAVVIPGLTSDSTSVYIRHLAFNTAKRGWNVVICNHRGLGGISVTVLTLMPALCKALLVFSLPMGSGLLIRIMVEKKQLQSDCFYNAGWTTDLRDIINYLHNEYPKAPLFAIGTSLGANILVKYLGEDGEFVPVAGAAAICCPWDLLIGSRFIARRLVQKVYDMALASGLRGYAQINQTHISRLADWEGIKKSRSIREFDNYATCCYGNFETVDTYYRLSSSAPFTRFVSVPLLCISALDDPLCTAEAIPWDECRANKNIVLATTKHGGHLAFFEGITASGLWWVRAVNEFLSVLHSSTFMHTQTKAKFNGRHSAMESSIDHGPYVNLTDGMVSAMGNEPETDNIPRETEAHSASAIKNNKDAIINDFNSLDATESTGLLDQLSRQNKKSI